MSTETKGHTPGPWRAILDDNDHGGGHLGYIEDSRGYVIADVVLDGDQIGGSDPPPPPPPPPLEEARRNGILIAAAPDLLEALRECADQIAVTSSLMGGDPTVEMARAAIAKATGSEVSA